MTDTPAPNTPANKDAAATHTPTAVPVDDKKRKRHRKHLLRIMTVIFVVIGLVWLIYWLCWGRFHEYTDDAYVAGNQVRLMAQVAGTVTAINTDDTQLVLEGQSIIKLDDTDSVIALERAKANLADTVRQTRKLYENVKQMKASTTLRQADLLKARLDYERRQGMVGERAISREEMQHYLTAMEAAQANFDLAKSRYTAALGLVENTTLYHHPAVETARVNLKNAYLNLVRTDIVSPVTGYVAKRSVQLGQQVSMQTAMMAIVPLNEVWVEANYKESQLGRLRIGQPVILTADAYSGVTYHGKVHGLSAGTGSTFDLLPPQNATGNWIKIVQRVPVRIDLDPEEIKQHPLRLGLSMRVTTDTYDTGGHILVLSAEHQPLLQTSVFKDQLANAEQLIDGIVQSNAPDVALASTDTILEEPAIIPLHETASGLPKNPLANNADSNQHHEQQG
jgi:membrane fusion protein (multidrug efflux system)